MTRIIADGGHHPSPLTLREGGRFLAPLGMTGAEGMTGHPHATRHSGVLHRHSRAGGNPEGKRYGANPPFAERKGDRGMLCQSSA